MLQFRSFRSSSFRSFGSFRCFFRSFCGLCRSFHRLLRSFRNFLHRLCSLGSNGLSFRFRFTRREIEGDYRTLRTNFFAFTARLTFVRVDVCQIVLQRNCLERTYLYTLATADAGYSTGITGYSTLILVYALHINAAGFLALRTDFDNISRTSLGTCAASSTLGFRPPREVRFRDSCG